MEKEVSNSKTFNYLIAKFISRIFDVPVAGIMFLYLIWSNAPAAAHINGKAFFIFAFYSITITVLLIILFIRLKILDNWEVTNKAKRKYVYLIAIFMLTLISILAVANAVESYYLKHIVLAYIIVFVFGIITNFTNYKPSMHIGFWTIVLEVTIYYFGVFYLALTPVLVLIGWARYTIKNHTITELFLGFFIMTAIISPFLYYVLEK